MISISVPPKELSLTHASIPEHISFLFYLILVQCLFQCFHCLHIWLWTSLVNFPLFIYLVSLNIDAQHFKFLFCNLPHWYSVQTSHDFILLQTVGGWQLGDTCHICLYLLGLASVPEGMTHFMLLPIIFV